jgi:hypothetical protein
MFPSVGDLNNNTNLLFSSVLSVIPGSFWLTLGEFLAYSWGFFGLLLP